MDTALAVIVGIVGLTILLYRMGSPRFWKFLSKYPEESLYLMSRHPERFRILTQDEQMNAEERSSWEGPYGFYGPQKIKKRLFFKRPYQEISQIYLVETIEAIKKPKDLAGVVRKFSIGWSALWIDKRRRQNHVQLLAQNLSACTMMSKWLNSDEIQLEDSAKGILKHSIVECLNSVRIMYPRLFRKDSTLDAEHVELMLESNRYLRETLYIALSKDTDTSSSFSELNAPPQGWDNYLSLFHSDPVAAVATVDPYWQEIREAIGVN